MSNRKYETELLKMILNEDYEPGTSSPSKEARNAFLESVANFNNMGEAIYREDSLEECISRLRSIVEQASQVTMDESEHWFDKVTVSRHVKQLNEAMKVFEKTATEMNQLQQRLESSYDDIGMILNRYYNINEALKDSEYIKEGKKYKLNESAIEALADELSAPVFDAYSDGITIKAQSTTKTWDDGTPVLKYIARSSEKKVKLPKEFKVVDDTKEGWWYFQIGDIWYGLDQDEWGSPPFEY